MLPRLSLSSRLSLLALLIALIMPSLALAATFDWTNPPGDKSIYYLGLIFGNVSTALHGASGNAILGNLFNIFNIAVLTIGSLVVSYTIILSAINTAQEGEVMGKKWSSMWIPFRSAIGVAFLIPTASGYSLLQILLMNIIVLGVAAANQLWKEIVNSALSQTGSGVFGGIILDDDKMYDASSSILVSMICVRAFNNSTACLATLPPNSYASAYTDGNTLKFGVQGDPTYGTLCGYAKAGAAPKEADSTAVAGGLSPWDSANLSALINTAGALVGPAQAIVEGTFDSSQDVVSEAANQLSGGLKAAPINTNEEGEYKQTANQHRAAQNAINLGWIFAGSYYFMLMQNNHNLHWEGVQPVTDSSIAIGLMSEECQADLNTAIVAANDVFQESEDEGGSGGAGGALEAQSEQQANAEAAQLEKEIKSGKVKKHKKKKAKNPMDKMKKIIEKPLNKLANVIMKSLTTRNPDPITSLQEVGTGILIAAESLWFASMLGAFLALLGTCIMSGISPACFAVTGVITLLFPIIIAFISIMWAGGVALAIYTPLIPYLVFTFTAIGWLILVIEAMVAAPIIALGLVSPSQENLGRASPSVMIVTSVFLKPSLMILGFIVAAKLVRAAVHMINYGFMATVNASIGGLGIFGIIALIMIYCGVILSVISECFSLIHVLPDKIVRWIGGQAEASGVKEKLQESKAATQKGAEAGAGLMKGGMGWASEKAAEKRKEDKEAQEKQGITGKGGGKFFSGT